MEPIEEGQDFICLCGLSDWRGWMDQQSELCLFVAGCPPPSALNSRSPTSDKNIQKDSRWSDVCARIETCRPGGALSDLTCKCVDATYLKVDDHSSNGVSFGLKCTNQQRNSGHFILPTTNKVPSGKAVERFYHSTPKRQKRILK